MNSDVVRVLGLLSFLELPKVNLSFWVDLGCFFVGFLFESFFSFLLFLRFNFWILFYLFQYFRGIAWAKIFIRFRRWIFVSSWINLWNSLGKLWRIKLDRQRSWAFRQPLCYRISRCRWVYDGPLRWRSWWRRPYGRNDHRGRFCGCSSPC